MKRKYFIILILISAVIVGVIIFRYDVKKQCGIHTDKDLIEDTVKFSESNSYIHWKTGVCKKCKKEIGFEMEPHQYYYKTIVESGNGKHTFEARCMKCRKKLFIEERCTDNGDNICKICLSPVDNPPLNE